MTAQHYNDLSLASSKKQFSNLNAEIQSLKNELIRQYDTVEALNIEKNKYQKDLKIATQRSQDLLKTEIESLRKELQLRKSELDKQYHTVKALNIENNKVKKELKIATQTSQDLLKTEIESLKKELQRRKNSVLISRKKLNLKTQIRDEKDDNHNSIDFYSALISDKNENLKKQILDENNDYNSIDSYSAPISPFRRSPYE